MAVVIIAIVTGSFNGKNRSVGALTGEPHEHAGGGADQQRCACRRLDGEGRLAYRKHEPNDAKPACGHDRCRRARFAAATWLAVVALVPDAERPTRGPL